MRVLGSRVKKRVWWNVWVWVVNFNKAWAAFLKSRRESDLGEEFAPSMAGRMNQPWTDRLCS